MSPLHITESKWNSLPEEEKNEYLKEYKKPKQIQEKKTAAGKVGIVSGIKDLKKKDGRKRGLLIAAIVIWAVMAMAFLGALVSKTETTGGSSVTAAAETTGDPPVTAAAELPDDVGALAGIDPEISPGQTTSAGSGTEEKTDPIAGAVESASENKNDKVVSVDEKTPEETTGSSAENKNAGLLNQLEVHYIDVGQGDAALIVCGNEAMLVDAGDEDKGTAVQLYLKKHSIDHLKYVMASHPDADHIGGLDVIVYKFDCDRILVPNCSNDTSSYDKLQQSMKAKGYSAHVVDIGEEYTLGDARIEILSPSAEFTFAETNDSSIVFRLDHGDNSFLFTGDATIPPQQALIYDPDLNIDVDVLKVPHHGASTAYMKGFYDEVSPEYAVISCGKGNRYGHPRKEVLDDLKSRGSKVYRTDEQSTIVATSDGKEITFNKQPSTTWQPGEILDSEDDAENSGANGSQQNLSEAPEAGTTYVYNSNSGKFHRPDCSSVKDIKAGNRVDLNCSREELLQQFPDASPCKRCNP